MNRLNFYNYKACKQKAGFTLVEIMVVLGIFSLVMAGALALYLFCQRLWIMTSLNLNASRDVNQAVNKIVYGQDRQTGIRAASEVQILTNFNGICTSTNYPLPATSTAHNLSSAGLKKDGSWRMVVSTTNGQQWIDYNAQASNLVFWPETNVIQSRLLIADYISKAQVSTNSKGTLLALEVESRRRRGRDAAVCSLSTLVKLRNKGY